MKNFICGFICGAVIFTFVCAFAAGSVYKNTYPVTMNGKNVSIEGYNIDDYSYFKLRDIAEATGGFEVDFKDDTILLTSKGVSSPKQTEKPSENADKYRTKDEFKFRTYTDDYSEGRDWVDSAEINQRLESMGYGERFEFPLPPSVLKDKKTGETVFENVPYAPHSLALISIDYYKESILPWLRSLE